MWELFVLSDQLFCNLKTALKKSIKEKEKATIGDEQFTLKNNDLSVFAPLFIVTELKIIS